MSKGAPHRRNGVSLHHIAKMYRPLVEEALASGEWDLEVTKRHYRLRNKTTGGFVGLGSTPSDPKSILAIRSTMKRGGIGARHA